mgnify:CR=1 FL=1
MRIEEKQIKNEAVVCVVGLGYVGQPLAEAFSNSLRVIGFDVDENKIKNSTKTTVNNIIYTADPSSIERADFVIITVEYCVDESIL